MNTLFIQGTQDKPHVSLKPEGELSFEGLSLPHNVYEVYNPIMDWIESYKAEHVGLTTVSFNFEYLNTASTNMVARLIESLTELNVNNSLHIKWHYQLGDSDMKELGEDLSWNANCEFEFIELAT